MEKSETAKAPEISLTQQLIDVLRYWLSGRRGLIAVAVLAAVGGIVMNWGWLAAAGIAPIILAVLPCAAMCALGLCANKMMGGKSSCSGSETPSKTAEPADSSTARAIRQNAADQNREGRPDSAPGKNAA